MTLPTWYDAGTVSVAGGRATVTGTGTLWGGDAIMIGDLFCDLAQPLVPPQRVASVTDDGSLELAAPWPGVDMTDAAYEIRYVGIIERSTAQSRKVLEQLGDVKAWADVFVEDDAARLALETPASPLRANYRVMVKETGAIWAKKTGAFDDWIGPAEFRGPAITLDVTEVDEVPYGAPPNVTLTPRAGGYDVVFDIPRGMIIEPGATTTLASDQPAAVTFVPVIGGYRLDIAIPRGATGSIDGVTPFWQSRITNDTTLAAARAGLTPGERGVFTPPNFAIADLTPADVRSLLGNVDGFYKFATVVGGNVQFPPGFPQTHGVIVGYVNSPSLYGYSWQELTGPSGNRKWMRRAASATTWTPFAEFWHSGNMPLVSRADAEAGVGTAPKAWSEERVAQAISALAPEVPPDVYQRSNVIGMVSQAFGIPTGALMTGWITTVNGRYWRGADGWQICLNEVTLPAQAISTPANTTGTFAAPFVDTGITLLHSPRTGQAGNMAGIGITMYNGIYIGGLTETTFTISSYSYRAATTLSTVFSTVAFGRWFV